jgi:fatty acid desaturase
VIYYFRNFPTDGRKNRPINVIGVKIMAKDKILGAVIMLVGVLIIVFYTFWGPLSLYWQGSQLNQTNYPSWLSWFYVSIPAMNWAWAVVLPLWLIVVLVGVIAAWIGFSMLTTPPPVPLEELEEELEAEENASKGSEAKTEEASE